MKHIGLDFEAGGTVPGQHAPVTLGVSLWEDAQLIRTQEWLFAPPTDWKGNITRSYEVAALEVSGIPWPRIKRDGFKHAQVLRELAEFADGWRNAEVLAYRAAFDLGFYQDVLFLAGEYNRHTKSFDHFTSPLLGPWRCVYMESVAALNMLPDYKLDTVARHLGLGEQGEKHSAVDDSILAARIHFAITNEKPLTGEEGVFVHCPPESPVGGEGNL